jgi:hypothetical protein
MAYTNAIYYLDYTTTGNGDATRATLTGVVFAQQGADGVRGHFDTHGLVTGAVIGVTGCTQAYANSAWKITYVDVDNFDLDGASWASFTGADVTGNAVPRGGMNWTDAWKTITSGPTSGRMSQTQPAVTGQQIRVLGYATSSSNVYFKPDATIIEVA